MARRVDLKTMLTTSSHRDKAGLQAGARTRDPVITDGVLRDLHIMASETGELAISVLDQFRVREGCYCLFLRHALVIDGARNVTKLMSGLVIFCDQEVIGA